MAIVLTVMLLFTGLAVDTGRAYVVKAQLSKAVDGAALGAARLLNSGDPKAEAINIFKSNFPAGYMGVSTVTDPTTAADFFTLTTDDATGVNVITIKASAVLPTTFMQLANFQQVTVGAAGQATRRMVDLSLVLDVSSSIGSQWPTVRDAARIFVNAFDAAHDRISLLTFSN
jgi:Flp pilus assembly protein TadG